MGQESETPVSSKIIPLDKGRCNGIVGSSQQQCRSFNTIPVELMGGLGVNLCFEHHMHARRLKELAIVVEFEEKGP